VNAHTTVCGRSAITNRVRASVWAFTHALANVDLAVETLFPITPVRDLSDQRVIHIVAGVVHQSTLNAHRPEAREQ